MKNFEQRKIIGCDEVERDYDKDEDDAAADDDDDDDSVDIAIN